MPIFRTERVWKSKTNFGSQGHMSKQSEKHNQPSTPRLLRNRLAFSNAGRVGAALSVVVVSAVCCEFFTARDLTAGEQPGASRATVTLGTPSFVQASNTATGSYAPEARVNQFLSQAPQQHSAYATPLNVQQNGAINPNHRNAGFQLIDTSKPVTGPSAAIQIQSRLGSQMPAAVVTPVSSARTLLVGNGVVIDESAVAANPEPAAPALSIPAVGSIPTQMVAQKQTNNSIATGTNVSTGAAAAIAVPEPAARQPDGPLLAQNFANAQQQSTVPHMQGLPVPAPPIMNGQPYSAGNYSMPASEYPATTQSVQTPRTQFGPPAGAMPRQAVPMIPVPIPSTALPLPQYDSGHQQAPTTNEALSYPQGGQQYPQVYGNEIPSIEAMPLNNSPNAKADGYSSGYSNQIMGQPNGTTTVQPPNFGHSVFNSYPGTSGFRATVEADAGTWMAPYTSRAVAASDFAGGVQRMSVPAGFGPWWESAVKSPVSQTAARVQVDVRTLLQDAMLYSPQVTAIQTEPEVQYRVITQEEAKFDWSTFLEATYDDLNDPVGNDLTTGNGQDRLLTRKVSASGGLRSNNIYGGETRIAQDIGHENQNSRFFVPNNQGSARLELSYRQPLMDGAGRTYNESEIVLARIQANAAEDEVVDALQTHLIEVTESYWTLFRARAEFFQRQKLLTSANAVLARLEGRSQVDTIPRQVLRARAAVARADTRTRRTYARVKDAEAQLRLLVNSPDMLNGGAIELMPMEVPGMVTESADLQSVLQTALINRPDISEAIRKMRAAGVRLGVSRNELLPRLDFLVETYVADLAGNSKIQRAIRGELGDNRPGYTVGLEFEIPIGNRAAVAKVEQRQWELKRSINIFRATVEKSLTDVEIASREVRTAYSEISSRYESMKAAENESNYLQDRFEVLPASEDSAILLLEDLLDSFERMADEESAFVQAQVDHAVALVKLKKELGILLKSRNDRPQVDDSHMDWMQGRLESTVNSQFASASSPPTGSKPMSGNKFQTVSAGNQLDLNFGGSNSQSEVGAALAPRPSEIQGTTRPMPMFPTTWDRLPDTSNRPMRQ